MRDLSSELDYLLFGDDGDADLRERAAYLPPVQRVKDGIFRSVVLAMLAMLAQLDPRLIPDIE